MARGKLLRHIKKRIKVFSKCRLINLLSINSCSIVREKRGVQFYQKMNSKPNKIVIKIFPFII